MKTLEIQLIVVLVVLIIINVSALVTILIKINTKDACHSTSSTSNAPQNQQKRIIGGRATNIAKYRFIAAIVIKRHGNLISDRLQCGCTIISDKWVLTAAHCLGLIHSQGFTKQVVYISGNSDNWNKGRKHEILHWVNHERYDDIETINDICLMMVKQPFDASYEVPIAMASKKYQYKANTDVVVLGWGVTNEYNDDPVKQLNEVQVTLFDQNYCSKLYRPKATIDRSMVCAGYKWGGKDSCQFDSGGPLVQNNVLIGVVSWGIACAKADYPGVYARVSLLQNWISTTTKRYGSAVTGQFKP